VASPNPGLSPALAADWPVYHGDPARTGLASSFPSLGSGLTQAWSTALDGAVYGEPLGVAGQVIVATENDTVYSLDPTTGSVTWHQHLGTPVPLSSLPCGDIDPLGITSTPVYDSASGSVFVVAEVTGPAHTLFALDASTGAVRWSRRVDLAGHDPTTHQQRAALALGNGYVYIGFGGLSGDCGQYRGAVVGVPTSGAGATIAYQVPVAREGAVWATGGPVIDAAGNLYVSVGNGSSTTTYDGSDSVLELSPNLALLSRFAPAQWADDNATDADLGSLSPVLVPGGWVFIAGKSGIGYVLKQGALGGIGGEVHSATVCPGFGGAAIEASTIYVPCSNGLRMVQIGAGGVINAGWQTSSGATGPPVIGGGAVWSVSISSGTLDALSEADGSVLASISVGPVPHFDAPTLWDGLVLVGTLSGVVAVEAAVPSAAATYHSLGVSRILDTRYGTGLTGAFTNRVAREFSVGGAGGVDPSAIAVTGNLTVTGPTQAGYVSLTTTPQSAPGTSTINFPLGDTRANGVTLGLAGGGGLWATYVASGSARANLIFDVTGFFTPDVTGATYHSLTPTRILDTRSSTRLTSTVPLEFPVTGQGGVPTGAIAVTGNLTVTGQTRAGYVSLTTTPESAPPTSTINVPLGDTRANGVTAQLTGDGQLWATYVGGSGTTNLIFDVTGYFTPDATGATYHSLGVSRILDTRYGTGLTSPFTNRVAREFSVAGAGGVDPAAIGVTGNLTMTGQTRAGYVSLTTTPQSAPATSTINTPLGDTRANGVTLGLAGNGGLWATYVASGSARANLIFDVTGFFTP
jgi:polyvinyl alcohol dehydrogenase (cytochrome)